MAKKPVQINVNAAAAILKNIQVLAGREVLVGIPSEKAERADEDNSSVNNAVIGYVMETGAPELGIPARPFLGPGIRDAKPKLITLLYRGAKRALEPNAPPNAVLDSLNAAGMVAVSAVKKRIQDGPFVPLKPATIAARARARGTKSRRKSEKEYLKMVKEGWDEGTVQSALDIHPLINTGQLRNSITYVLRSRVR